MSSGFYGNIDGAGEVFVHTDLPGLEQILSELRENLRRAAATVPADLLAAEDAAAERLADRIARALPDVEVEVVSRVFMICLSTSGGLLAIGATPAQFLNVSALAAAKIGGHLPRTGAGS